MYMYVCIRMCGCVYVSHKFALEFVCKHAHIETHEFVYIYKTHRSIYSTT